MRIHAKSSSTVVQQTFEQAIAASGHIVCEAADAELTLSDQMHPENMRNRSACITLRSARSSVVQAISVPVQLPHLMRMLQAVHAPQDLLLGNQWRLDLTERRAVHADAGTLSFTEKECALLTVLLQAYPTSIGRETLLAKVWGMREDIDTHTLETHIYRLRQKFESVHPTPGDIATEQGSYRYQEGSNA